LGMDSMISIIQDVHGVLMYHLEGAFIYYTAKQQVESENQCLEL